MRNKKIMLVDGHYFGYRGIFIQSKEKEFLLNTDKEMTYFKNWLLGEVQAFTQNFINLVDDIVFVFDSYSWRKKVDPFVPYYYGNQGELTHGKDFFRYKNNRNEIKEESPINWQNFDVVLQEFANDILSMGYPVFKMDGFEGDDLLYFLSDRLSKNDNKVIIYCTDGDLKQLITNENIMLFRNIKSKASPYGEFLLHPNLFEQVNSNVSLESMLISNNPDKEYIKKLTNFDGIDRQLGTSTLPQTSIYDLILEKVISGDAKDNILPILRWSAKTGSRFYRATAKHIHLTFDYFGVHDDEQKRNLLLTNEFVDSNNKTIPLKNFLQQLATTCKQLDDLNENFQGWEQQAQAHFNHNKMLNFLNEYVYNNMLKAHTTRPLVEDLTQKIDEYCLENVQNHTDLLARIKNISQIATQQGDNSFVFNNIDKVQDINFEHFLIKNE